MPQRRRAVVLLSGGLDSATTLAIARGEGFDCHALSVDYGQRHDSELAAARRVAESLGAVEHRIVKVDLRAIGGSALTDDTIPVPTSTASLRGDTPGESIPPTYVPARNTLLLSLALGFAEVLDTRDIFIGVNAVDYSGYPDCRPEFIDAFQTLAKLATKAGVEGHPVKVHTPLIELSKADIIAWGTELDVDYGLTVSCYRADSEGRACGVCDSCRIRGLGFEAAGIADPAVYFT